MKVISLIIAVFTLAIGASILANMYTNARYEIDDIISQEKLRVPMGIRWIKLSLYMS